MVFIVTRIGGGFGLGHYRRMEVLERYLNSKGIPSKVFLAEECNEIVGNRQSADQSAKEPKSKNTNRENLKLFLGSSSSLSSLTGKLDPKSYYPLCKIVILDVREADTNFVRKLLADGKIVISLDDVETYKPSIVSIVSLPYVRLKGPKPNFVGYKYLLLDPNLLSLRTSKEFDLLVTFGGEDPRNLTRLFIENFLEYFKSYKICVFTGDLFKDRESIEKICTSKGVRVFSSADVNLHELIARSDIIITSFGMSVYEALVLGKKVLLLNGSEYHHMLYKASKLENSGRVREIGYLRDDGVLVRRVEKPCFNDSQLKGRRVIDIYGNLARWEGILSRLSELKNVDLSILSSTTAEYRSTRATRFITEAGEKIELRF